MCNKSLYELCNNITLLCSTKSIKENFFSQRLSGFLANTVCFIINLFMFLVKIICFVQTQSRCSYQLASGLQSQCKDGLKQKVVRKSILHGKYNNAYGSYFGAYLLANGIQAAKYASAFVFLFISFHFTLSFILYEQLSLFLFQGPYASK